MPTRNTRSTVNRRVVIARGSDAAARLRSSLRAVGYAKCAKCGLTMLASAIDVDHILPLYKGGEDVDSNVQPLCRAVCHKAKTRVDMAYAAR